MLENSTLQNWNCRGFLLWSSIISTIVIISMYNYSHLNVKITFTNVPPRQKQFVPISNAFTEGEKQQDILLRNDSSDINSNGFQNVTLIPEWNCSEAFVTIFDGGRLGNNICQFMSLLLFRIEMGMRIAMSKRMKNYLLKVFKSVSVPVLPNSCFPAKRKSTYIHGFDKVFEKLKEGFHKKKNLKLFSGKYFNYITNNPCPISYLNKHRDRMRNILVIRNDLLKKAQYKIQKSLSSLRKNKTINSITLVSTHVRRTDYLSYSSRKNLTFPSVDFYKRAFEFYRKSCKNPVFVVISDDLKWVKENFSDEDIIFPGTGEISNPEVDYVIMTLCHHHIVGLGTFGMTSAFLGKGSALIFKRRKEAEISDAYFWNKTISCSSSDIFII